MAAGKRATNIAVARMPADRRYVSLMEFRWPLLMDDGGRLEFNETVNGFVMGRTVPLATILLVAPGNEEVQMVVDMAAVYRQSRPVQICIDPVAAWQAVNAVLRAADLPEQPAPEGFRPA
jgi:hypothetical protein